MAEVSYAGSGMRCPACGTENSEMDSRFCPHCGGRMGTAEPRVAPTVKITDNRAAVRPSGAQAQQLASRPAPVPLFPPYAPETAPRTSSRPPTAGAVDESSTVRERPSHRQIAAPSQPPSQPSQPSQSPRPSQPQGSGRVAPSKPMAARPAAPVIAEPAPRRGRRMGLVVVLLIVDLGLAGAGTFLLLRGLYAPAAVSASGLPSTTQTKAP